MPAAAAPADFDRAAKAKWNSTRKLLEAEGHWQESFVDALERYVRAWAQAKSAREELERLAKKPTPDDGDPFVIAGFLQIGSTGQLTEHSLVRIAARADKDAASYADDLLLTPKARRGRAGAGPKDPEGGGGAFGDAFGSD